MTLSSVVSHDLIVKGAEVLSVFSDKELFNRFHSRLYKVSMGLCIPEIIGKGWGQRLYTTYGSILTAGKTEQLQALSESVWCNTLKPVKFDGSTNLSAWLDLTSGKNLRWPVLGILACLVGIASRTLISSDPIFASCDGTFISSKRLAVRMWEVAEACIVFCRDFEIVDDLFVFLLCESDAITGSIRGETSKNVIAIDVGFQS